MFHAIFPFWPAIIAMIVGLSLRHLILKLSHHNKLLRKFLTSSWPQFIIIFILSVLAILLNFKRLTPAIIFWFIVFNLGFDALTFWLDTPPKK